MASKSALDKLQETVVGTVRGVAKDPVGTARGALALGRSVAGQVVDQVTRTVKDRVGGSTPPTTPAPLREPEKPTAAPVPKPTDVARVVEKKPAAAKKAPPKKAPAKKAPPAKKSTPSAKLPPPKAD